MLVMLWYPGIVVPKTRPSAWVFIYIASFCLTRGDNSAWVRQAGNKKHEGWFWEHLSTIHWYVHVMHIPWSKGRGEGKDNWYKLLVRGKKAELVLQSPSGQFQFYHPSVASSSLTGLPTSLIWVRLASSGFSHLQGSHLPHGRHLINNRRILF